MPRSFLMCSLAVWAVALPAAAALPVAHDRSDVSEGPHFVLEDQPSGTDPLPLKASRADIKIAGVIAEVTVRQTWQNRGQRPLEAVYVFPGSTRAAVHDLTMKVGERTLRATLKEREAARKDYEDARNDGKTASLLEQERPNVFQMSVANILPGDVIEVTLVYTEHVSPEGGVYELVYPQVVGPRYGTPSPEGAPGVESAWSTNPHLAGQTEDPFQWSIDVEVITPLGLAALGSPSHGLRAHYASAGHARVEVQSRPGDPGSDRDFVLRYKLKDEQVQTGLMLYRTPRDEENFFLLMVEPPERVAEEAIPSRELVFIVDVSGSMGGFPLDVTRSLMDRLLGDLRPEDSFNVLLFSGGSALLAPESLPANRDNLEQAKGFLHSGYGGGGTELSSALQRALALPADSTKTSRSFIVLTDGFVNVERETFHLVEQRRGEANLFAFGIGSSVNRHLIEGLAHAGLAEPFFALNHQEAEKEAERFAKLVLRPVLTNVRVRFDGFDAYDVEPGALPDLLADRPLTLFGKFRGPSTGKVTVTGVAGGGKPFRKVIHVEDSAERKSHRPLRVLWARERLRQLDDFGDSAGEAQKSLVTAHGLRYGLLTRFTSFVAVDDRSRTVGGATTVAQPSLAPRGVALAGLGGGSASASYGVGGLGVRGVGAGGGGASGGGVGTGGRSYGSASGSLGGRADREVRMSQGKAIVLGSLDKNLIQRVLREHRAQVRYCYERELAKTPDLEGKVVLKIVLSGEGKVQQAVVVETTLGSAAVETCLVQKAKTWRFPKPEGGGVVIVQFPFVFRRGS